MYIYIYIYVYIGAGTLRNHVTYDPYEPEKAWNWFSSICNWIITWNMSVGPLVLSAQLSKGHTTDGTERQGRRPRQGWCKGARLTYWTQLAALDWVQKNFGSPYSWFDIELISWDGLISVARRKSYYIWDTDFSHIRWPFSASERMIRVRRSLSLYFRFRVVSLLKRRGLVVP